MVGESESNLMKPTTVNKTENHFASAKLTEALNLICLYVADRLPEEWEIVLRMSHREATLDLLDEHGTDHSSDASTGDWCALVELCDYALEVEAAKAQPSPGDVVMPEGLLDGLGELAFNVSASSPHSWENSSSFDKCIHNQVAEAVAVEVLRRLRADKPAEQASASQ